MTVFVSHATEDKAIAEQWQTLIHGLTANLVDIWYSTDLSTAGGMPGGYDWRTALIERLSASRVIIALLTLQSNARPWIYWECGAAVGVNADRPVFPIIYGMKPEDIPGPLSGYQMYDGCNRAHVHRVCEQILQIDNKQVRLSAPLFNTLYRSYIKQVTKALTASSIPKRQIQTFDLHKRYINDVDWLDDRHTIFATASEDETVSLTPLLADAPVRSLQASAAAKCLASAPDRQALIYGTSNGEVSLWRFEPLPDENAFLFNHPLVRTLSYSPRHALIASGGYDKCLSIHELARGPITTREVMQSKRSDVVRALAWAPQDLTLAFAAGAEVNILSLSSALQPVVDPMRLLGHTGVVLSISWNSSGSLVASGDEDGTVIVWNPLSRKHTVRLDRSATLDAARSLSFHPSLQQVFAVGGKSGVLELVKISDKGAPRIVTLGRFGTFINGIRWHQSGSPILFADGGTIKAITVELPADFHERI